MSVLQGARVVLYVTGGIAAYKASDLASKLTQAGTEVDVVLSRAAEDFVGPLTFQALTQRTVYRADDAMTADNEIAHVRLAADADVLVIAPATANAIARLAHGQADDLGSAIALSTQAPIVVAPAMEPGMYANPATQENLETLRRRGVRVIEPDTGRMASGAQGQGRLPETPVLLDVIRATLGRDGPLKNRVLVVSAGGTREYMDPVRFIGNPASGRQGVELARAAIERGATTRLVLGSGTVEPPAGAETTRVESAEEMLDALREAVRGCDALIMNAAVGDYRPAATSDVKLKRGGEPAGIDLIENPDLLQSLKGDFLRIGFAAETNDHLENARSKLLGKELDALVVNDVAGSDTGFAAETNAVTILRPEHPDLEVPLTSKSGVASAVLDVVVEMIGGR
ncbi:MAG: bifunctional phosphopantothenoylcysteine decarboxylase/phosphopantothenate--cysteine ligase CoaBC [Chloroflexota bacterium]|nr:bifunctional phosphopantothenoylcysteine decarboxylase/phosphopantothenate--cysteine ligase CoaBC [Chloroflexota bacterium]MDE2897622.1 bifunctional phosphopantothenoylcysteine decarboxylase/phosphopantothenate--cysteine ligase CoaBC [Chloroflexota bacterium]